MSSGLAEPVLIANLLHLDKVHLTIAGTNLTVDMKPIFYTWVAMGALFLVSLIVSGKLKLIPTGMQNFFEFLIDGLESFTVDTMGEKGRTVFPTLCAMFIFIITMNLMGLLPGFDAPTANVNTNAAMAIFVFCYYNWKGLCSWGPGYIKHFMGPMLPLAPLMLPLEIISHLARPLSMTLRLFGNIHGEEIVLIIFFLLAPIAATLPIYFLFGIAKCLQAFIFFLLTMIYLKGAMEHAH